MLDTEGDPPAPSQVLKRKRTKAGTQSRTKGKVAKKAAESFSREELNLRLDLHPVSFYVSDRDNLVDQLFTILSGDELQKMIPATLQGYSLAEIRERVTLEAKKYEDDDIYKIIHDAVPNVPKPRKDANIATALEGDLQAIDVTSTEPLPKSHHDTLELCPDQGEIDSLIDTESKDAPSSSPVNDKVETNANFTDTVKSKPDGNEIQQQIKPNDDMTNLSGVGTEWVSSLAAKSQLEILELEMRARAIRSLMKAQGMPVPDDESEEETEIGEQDLQEDDDDEEESVKSGKPLVELPESEMLRGNIGVDDRVEETEERETEVESDSVSSECETCVSEREIVVVPQQEESAGDDLRKVETSAMEIVTTVEEELVEPTVTLVETERVEERKVAHEERVTAEVIPEEEIVEEEIPTKTMEEEVEKLVSMILLKVVSDEVEASEKRERRNRRQLRRNNAKIMESDLEEGQIQDDSDSNDLSE